MKILIGFIIWLNILFGILFVWKLQPQIKEVIKEVKVEVPVEVEKIVYREGKEIVEVEKQVTVFKACSPEIVRACRRERQMQCQKQQQRPRFVSTDMTWVGGY